MAFRIPPQAAFELKLIFLRELDQSYRVARQALDALLRDPADKAGLEELRTFFHKVAGNAAAVDLALLGQLAAVCEGAADLLRQGQVTAAGAGVALLSDGLMGVASVLDSHGAGATASAQAPAVPAAPPPAAPARPEGEGGLSKILIVDDDAFSANLISLTLRSAGFESSHCSDPTKALATIEAELPDLLILDVVMPVIDGFDLCRRVRAHPAMQLTPIIFVTRKGDVEQRVAGLEAGGNDYIAKPFDPQELVARVRSLLQRLAVLQDMAIRDGLTRCFNHKYFKTRLDQEIARSRRYKSALTVAMFDVDHFKRVNDGHGHPAGDAVLAQLAGVALASVRSTDVVARYGGEEFGILLIEAGAKEAAIVANRIRERVAAHVISYLDPGAEAAARIQVTISGGVALLRPDDTVPSILQRADAALYEAKAQGRNQVRIAPEPG